MFADTSPQIGHERGMVNGPDPTFWRGARQVIGRCGCRLPSAVRGQGQPHAAMAP
jgi:hypothetical protein